MNYAMYTTEGNAAVHSIVKKAIANSWSWQVTFYALEELARSQRDIAGEALDTAVREMVYVAIGADQRDEDFYV